VHNHLPLPGDIADALERVRPRLGGTLPRVWYADTVGSTNDIAEGLASHGAPDGTIVLADLQTAGRGRLGRTWFSPPGAGLYVSIVARPATRREVAFSLMTLTAGVALADGVRACTYLPVDIKWPNDLVVGRRKLAGILTEASGAGALDHAVVGFGINLRSAAYPADVGDRATSIEAELGRPVERGLILAECVASLAAWASRVQGGGAESMLDRWRQLSPTCRGTPIRWQAPSGLRSGVTDGLDDDGALRVRTAGDKVERIVAGEVLWST
jgi:BirA family biotin operon repressor/biotin-[acetyl-CoA-carboxylase] ligase